MIRTNILGLMMLAVLSTLVFAPGAAGRLQDTKCVAPIDREHETTSVVGAWNGAIDVAEQHIEIHVTFSGTEPIAGTIDIPAQSAMGLALTNIDFSAPALAFELPTGSISARFSGSVTDDLISGKFEQGGAVGTFQLSRAAGATTAAGREERRTGAAAPAVKTEPDYGESPITLKTPTGTLYGTLTLPGQQRPPVALLIAGSGPTDRNGNSTMLPGPNNSLLLLARRLADRGIATVRYDKRGIGESSKAMTSEAELTFDDYVDDAVSWVSKLAADARFSGVAIIGHSEGSLIGMLAASKSGTGAFVSIAGIGEPADDLLRKQLASLPDNSKNEVERILAALKNGQTVPDVDPSLNSLFRSSIQPYMISWLKYDPSRVIAGLKIPVEIVQGDADLQVKLADAEALKSAKPDARLVVVDGMNHVMKSVGLDTALNQASYSDPSLPVAPELVDAVAGFLLEVIK
jgi:pimeloyl-ACP methyl ester carboxylesterase